jgi:tetratricopeptide (TPR) repeat protein
MSTKKKLLLVGWDAADWKILNPLIERSEMPVFTRLVDRGAIADMITLEPVLSPLLWNSVATGKRPDQHGILGFTEVDAITGRVRPVASTSRRTKAIWNILSQNGFRTNVVGWFGGHPAEPIRGACVSDAFARGFRPPGEPWPLADGTVYPESIAPALADLRIAPHEIDEEMFRLFVPRLGEVDRSKPNPLAPLAKTLAECFTTHAAATWLMENTEWDFMAVYYIGIDHFSHTFMNFHPPRMDWVDQKDFDLYHDVVNGGYRLMDLFLGRLLQLAGPETTVMVISDHGFHSDHLRPSRIPRVPTGPAEQHRPLGIFALAGPGIKTDERIYGINLLDVAPTLLTLFGLPAGDDMPGRVLGEAFEEMPALGRIASWDEVEGESGMHPPGYNPPLEDSDRLIEQFVALGYIEAQPAEREKAAALCRRENKWNLVRVYTGTWRFAEALPPLEELCAEAPERADFALALADCQLRLGFFEEARGTVAWVVESRPESPIARYVLGKIAFEQRRFGESLEHFLAAESAGAGPPDLFNNIGLAYLKLRRWRDAARAFERALEADPHSAIAHQGLSRVCLRLGRFEEAAERALTSVACRHDLPLSHFWLGVALIRLGQRDRAIRAFETSLSFHPPLRISHRMLAGLYGDTPQGRLHAQAAKDFIHRRQSQLRRMEGIRQEARHRAMDRRETERPESHRTEEESPAGPALEFIIVSGLPRSGTSLMMRMLEAAGLPVMSDGRRRADEDNPTGYYEWEAIKTIASRPSILREAEGKAIKVVSALLPSLPKEHRYKVIFMDRPVTEVVASQSKMIRNRGAGEPADPAKMARMLTDHRNQILRGLQNSKSFEVLVVDYPDLMRSREAWLPRIESFLSVLPSPAAMGAAIRQDLHRNRASM